MKDNIKLGRVAGFPLAMNWSVLIIAWLLTWSLATTSFPHHAVGHAELTYWLTGLGTAVIFFVSLLAHEVAHALVARRHGVEVTGLTLWLFGGVASLGSEPTTPRADFRIAVAGPAASLGLAGAFELVAIGLRAFDVGHLVVVAAAWLAGINLMLGVFNLIPGAPLDGGRILRAFLWQRHGDRLRATVSAARAGRVLAFVLIGLGLLEFVAGVSMGGLWLVFIGWFVLTAARAEEADAVARKNLDGLQVADVMSRRPLVAPGSMTVSEFIDTYVLDSRHSAYPVTGIDGEVIGMVKLMQIRHIRHAGQGSTLLAQIAASLSEVLLAAPGDPAVSLLDRLDQESNDRAFVLDDGNLVGIVTRSDLARAAELRPRTSQERRLVP